MLMKQSIDPREEEAFRSIKFSDSVERIVELVKERRIQDYRKLRFVLNAKQFLERLNSLRNRILHRGTYVLRYETLDDLVGQHVLPFVETAMRLPIYTSADNKWRYPKLHCRTDPIRKIIAEARQQTPSRQRIALLKELGRAAYASPLPRGAFRRQRQGTRVMEYAEVEAKRIAKSKAKEAGVVEVKVCPVCGVKSLLVYGDIRSEEGYDPRQDVMVVFREEFFTYEVRCLCCSFQIEDELEADAFSGLPIRPYWRVEQLLVK
jgi:hypothetical protein